jgi:hypothetical protein
MQRQRTLRFREEPDLDALWERFPEVDEDQGSSAALAGSDGRHRTQRRAASSMRA